MQIEQMICFHDYEEFINDIEKDLKMAKIIEIEVNSVCRVDAKCYEHEDKNASCVYDLKHKKWYCFGCGESGIIQSIKLELA